jgi:hypothetical protein
MYPHERSLVKRLEGKPFALIGVNSDRDREELKPILTSEQITRPNLVRVEGDFLAVDLDHRRAGSDPISKRPRRRGGPGDRFSPGGDGTQVTPAAT